MIKRQTYKIGSFREQIAGLKDTSYIITLFLSLISVFAVIFFDEFNISKYILGSLIGITSILLAVRCRKAKMLFLLTSLMAYTFLSAVFLHYFFLPAFKSINYETFWYLCTSQYSLIYAKSSLLTVVIISLIMTPKALNKAEKASVPVKEVLRKNNPIIAYVGLLGIAYILIFCITRSTGINYVANKNPLYEYGILVFVMVWYYSKNNKIAEILLAVAAAIYIGQALYYGVRSSAFILGVMVFMMVLKKSPGIFMVFLAILGIAVANLFVVYRTSQQLPITEVLGKYFQTMKITDFFSETAGDSYYTGIAIVASRQFSESPLYHLYKFVISIFTGGSSALAEGSVIEQYTKTIIPIPGGGVYPAYFYFYGKYIGVVSGAVLLGTIIRWYFTQKTSYHILATYMIAVFSLRWFIYSPLPLFRMCIFVYSTLFFLCYFFDKIYVKFMDKGKLIKK